MYSEDVMNAVEKIPTEVSFSEIEGRTDDILKFENGILLGTENLEEKVDGFYQIKDAEGNNLYAKKVNNSWKYYVDKEYETEYKGATQEEMIIPIFSFTLDNVGPSIKITTTYQENGYVDLEYNLANVTVNGTDVQTEYKLQYRAKGATQWVDAEEEFDQDIMGEYTGAGVIFGATGGVMEAALRTAHYVLTGKEHEAIKFEAVRGMEGLKEAEININGNVLKVAVASGMKNAKVLMDQIRDGKSPYAFIEIMGCPGGCVNGGGQPYVKPVFLPNEDLNIYDTYRQKRAQALYSEDERQALRQSHNNTQIQALYKEFLGEPNSHKAHELLHTSYTGKVKFPETK